MARKGIAMKWSKYSLDIFDHFTSKDGNFIVQACPGAGKTTNVKYLWTLDNKPTVYLVFNTHNKIEAQSKLPSKAGSDILTLNGLGHRAILNTFGKVVLDDKKVINIIRSMRRTSYRNMTKEEREREYILAKAVSIAKSVCVDNELSSADFDAMVSTYDIEEYPGMYSAINKVLYASDENTKVIDYADQLRFPVIYNCNMPEYDNVLGDEVQDFNVVQTKLVQLIGAKRYGLVGDTHQSIYGFRGAMNDAMVQLKTAFNCVELPLSITYRCSKAVTSEAAKLYNSIEPWEESPIGLVRHGDSEKEVYTANDIVLCRLNRPLIALAYSLLEKGTPCYVKGRDIGNGLINLIKKQNASSVRELIASLNSEYAVEYEKARVKEDDDKMQRVDDKYSSALLFCNRAKLEDSPEDVMSAIADMFSEGRGVCLSTVHKAKGLEAERALLLDNSLFEQCELRSKRSWQAVQERNVQYVAATRAKTELVYM